jgi:delta 1-pyrroline-5-carboxylate dehydrogenase
MAVHPNYINGAWASAAEPVPNINPSNVSDVVGEYARADEAQVRSAIADLLARIGNEILPRKDYAVEFYTTVKTAYVNA